MGVEVTQEDELPNHEILDDVDITQECLHFVKTKKMNSLILKMDLVKAYDNVDWTF